MDKIKLFLANSYAKFIIFFVVIMLLQALSVWGILPFSFGSSLTNTIIYTIVAVGFSYLLGYAGLASLGTAGFVGMGAYLTSFFLNVGIALGMIQFELPLIVILLLSIIISLVIGVIIGFISLRIEGIFLAIVTLGLSEVFYQVFLNATTLTGGPNGITLGRFPLIIPGVRFDRLTMMLFVTFVFAVLVLIAFNLGKSATGRAMLAMKNSTSAAQAMGISLMKYRLFAFVLSTIYGGIAGVLFMSFVRYTDPYSWSLMFSLNILAAVIFGGGRSLWGIMIGTFIVFGIIPMFLQDVEFLRDNSWLFNVIVGASLILIVLFYRGGVMQLFGDIRRFIEKKTKKAVVK